MKLMIIRSLVVLLLLGASAVRAEQNITFSTGASPDSHRFKLVSSQLEEALKRMGLEFAVEFHPSARSLDLSNGGRLDGEMHRVYKFHEVTNNAYPNLRRVDFSVTSTRISAFAREDLAIKNWQDLRKYKIAFNSGRKRTTKILQGLDIEDNLHSVTSEVKAFKMLAADRADVVISSQVQGIKIIKSSAEFSDIKEIALLDEVKLYPYVNKQHTDLIPTLIENLEEMRRDGSYDQILARVNSE